jgi:hypothetical protein
MRDFKAGLAGLGMTCAPKRRLQSVQEPFATVDRSLQSAGSCSLVALHFLDHQPTRLATCLFPDFLSSIHASATSENEPHDLLAAAVVELFSAGPPLREAGPGLSQAFPSTSPRVGHRLQSPGIIILTFLPPLPGKVGLYPLEIIHRLLRLTGNRFDSPTEISPFIIPVSSSSTLHPDPSHEPHHAFDQ